MVKRFLNMLAPKGRKREVPITVNTSCECDGPIPAIDPLLKGEVAVNVLVNKRKPHPQRLLKRSPDPQPSVFTRLGRPRNRNPFREDNVSARSNVDSVNGENKGTKSHPTPTLTLWPKYLKC